MPLFVYRCDKCGHIEEKFRPTEEREVGFDCRATLPAQEGSLRMCPGKMIFQPIQRTSFRFVDSSEKEAQG